MKYTLPSIPNFKILTDEHYMQRALDLALLGRGHVSPNPMVGCVIVLDGKIVGEGWHRKYGEAHAEVNAIESARNQLLSKATAFVNLEPCSHIGKTPPCADLLIQLKIKRVVISTLDTNPLVAGQGAIRLREAGVEVKTGVLHEEGRELNKRFFTAMELKRPYVILKWAETADGFMARENGESRWISNEQSRQRVHQWRSEEAAVLVGTRTAQHDNPRLNVRDWSGKDPVRVVIDRSLRLDKSLHVFDGSQSTLCYNLKKSVKDQKVEFVQLAEKNLLSDLLSDLNRRGLQSILVEGGATTLKQFISAGVWDEARVFRSTSTFGKGISAPSIHGRRVLEQHIMDDELTYYMNDQLTTVS